MQEFWIPQIINSLMLAATTVMAWLMYKTFKSGQQQTSISLAINQYNIYYIEFKGFLHEAQNLKFDPESDELKDAGIPNIRERFNGLNYIPTFLYPMKIYEHNIEKQEEHLMNSFRFGVLFPLTRYYDRLFHFLERIERDQILTKEYKSILYTYVERDLLQTYFRVCNYRFGNRLRDYNLEPFRTLKYDPDTFYQINEFYIKHNLFQFKNLEFYQKTT